MIRLLPIAAALLLAAPAGAAMKEAPRPSELPPAPDRIFLVSAQVGASLQDGPAMKQVYSRNHPLVLLVRGTFLFEERFGIGLTAGVQYRAGTGVAPSGRKAQRAELWQVPIGLEGMLRMALWRDQVAVPYLRGGFSAVVWHEIDFATDPWTRITGVKWGPHVGGGVQVRLPFPEINFEGRLSGDPLIDDIYFHVEGHLRSSNNFGAPGLDLSAAGVSLGLTLLL